MDWWSRRKFCEEIGEKLNEHSTPHIFATRWDDLVEKLMMMMPTVVDSGLEEKSQFDDIISLSSHSVYASIWEFFIWCVFPVLSCSYRTSQQNKISRETQRHNIIDVDMKTWK